MDTSRVCACMPITNTVYLIAADVSLKVLFVTSQTTLMRNPREKTS